MEINVWLSSREDDFNVYASLADFVQLPDNEADRNLMLELLAQHIGIGYDPTTGEYLIQGDGIAFFVRKKPELIGRLPKAIRDLLVDAALISARADAN